MNRCPNCKHHTWGTYLGVDFECAYDICTKKHDTNKSATCEHYENKENNHANA